MKTLILSLTIIFSISFSNGKGDEKKPLTQTISLKVVDTNNESIAGAEISIEGLGVVSYTDMEGNYNAEISANYNKEIKISFISYEDKVIKMNELKDGKIVLIEE